MNILGIDIGGTNVKFGVCDESYNILPLSDFSKNVFGETAEEAVVREVFEETGVHYEIDRLAVIHENFFTDSSEFFKDLNCHEIALYFLMKAKGNQDLNSDSYTQGVRENMVWIPIYDLDKHTVYPTFLKEYLSKEYQGIEHIVTIE